MYDASCVFVKLDVERKTLKREGIDLYINYRQRALT